jgi:hypothetical protein
MDFKSIVTYNGKAFDVPLLETRFILQRTPFPVNDLPHLDFLFSAQAQAVFSRFLDVCQGLTSCTPPKRGERMRKMNKRGQSSVSSLRHTSYVTMTYVMLK